MKVRERDKLDVADMKCLRSLCGVNGMDKVSNEVVREREDVPEKRYKGVDQKMFKWFGHVVRMGSEQKLK